MAEFQAKSACKAGAYFFKDVIIRRNRSAGLFIIRRNQSRGVPPDYSLSGGTSPGGSAGLFVIRRNRSNEWACTNRSSYDMLVHIWKMFGTFPYFPHHHSKNKSWKIIPPPLLLNISDMSTLHGHPMKGASWEGFVIEQIIALLPDWTAHFYRTSNGAEMDLVMCRADQLLAFEIK